MLKYVLKDLKRNKIIKLLIVFQMSAVLILTILMTSNIVSRYKLYKPIKNQLSGKGFVLNSLFYTDEELFILTSENEITNNLTDVKAVEASYISLITYSDLNTYGNAYIYSDKIFENMADEFADGKWYSDDSENIYAAVSSNNYNIKTGDEIHILTDSGEYTIVISGVLKEGARVLGNEGSFAISESDFEDLYTNVYSDSYLRGYYESTNNETKEMYKELMDEGDPYGDRYLTPNLYMSYNELSKMDADVRLYGNIFITFNDDISESNYNANKLELNKLPYIDNIVELQAMNERSKAEINKQLAQLLPIIICVYGLTLITTLCACVISTEKMLNNYSVFFVCGSSWSSLIKINLLSSVIISSLSTIVAIVSCEVANIVGLTEYTVAEFGFFQCLSCFVIIIVYLIISVIIPRLIMLNKSPKQIITEKK